MEKNDMTLEEQNEHANALMAIAAKRHMQFAKQLLTLAQQHLEHCINATPTSPRRNDLTDVNVAVLNAAFNLDRMS
jgi:predicted DNA binding protein